MNGRQFKVAAAAFAIALAASVEMSFAAGGGDAAAASAAWDKAYNASDTAALAQLYDTDAVSMAPGAASLMGRQAIAEDFQHFFSANVSRHRTIEPDRVVSGDYAIERARYEMTTTGKKAGSKPAVERGKHIVVWHRGGDGKWRVKWEIWNTN